MTLHRRLDKLEAHAEALRPHVRLVARDHPPDGRTRVWLDDGTELAPGGDWRPMVGEWPPTVVAGIDIDVVVGRKPGLPAAGVCTGH